MKISMVNSGLKAFKILSPLKHLFFFMQDGQKFDFPDIFYKSTPQGKEMDQFKKLQQDRDIETQETWQQRDIPIWFR